MPSQREPDIALLESPNWEDYALLDTGGGWKLERFGKVVLQRPEVQAIWPSSLPRKDWAGAQAIFKSSAEEAQGKWTASMPLPKEWPLEYRIRSAASEPRGTTALRFHARLSTSRHVGVFPEGAANWEWMSRLIVDRMAKTSAGASAPSVLNLFGYTGLATLTAAAAGARVTHVDASRTSVAWARANQEMSGLHAAPIRWIVDDAVKFVQRETRRGVTYDGIILDPPKFGRGPKGEVWELFKDLPALLLACRSVLSKTPLFVVATIYAVKASALHAYQAVEAHLTGSEGRLECGELVTREQSGGRLLSQAVFARWSSDR